MKEILGLFLSKFLSYSLEVFPFFLPAFLITGFLKVYLELSVFARILRNPLLSPLLSGLLASTLPVCSCSVIPLAYFIYQDLEFSNLKFKFKHKFLIYGKKSAISSQIQI